MSVKKAKFTVEIIDNGYHKNFISDTSAYVNISTGTKVCRTTTINNINSKDLVYLFTRGMSGLTTIPFEIKVEKEN